MLAHSIPFPSEAGQDFFQQLPVARGVFLLQPPGEGEPYIAKSADLRKRLTRLLSAEESIGRRLNLRAQCSTIHYSLTGSEFESRLLLYRLLKEHFPGSYTKRLKLRPAALVRLNWENEYPRAYVTAKFSRLGSRSRYYGPFRSRAEADHFLTAALDLFKSRRCTFNLDPDPQFPGCVYSEMKMCLAPCFKGCTDEEYIAEVNRLEQYLESCGESLLAEIGAKRDQASAGLQFEEAAALHARVEKVKAAVKGCDEMIRNIESIDAYILQRSAQSDTVNLYRFHAGNFTGPVHFPLHGMLLANDKSGDTSLFSQPFAATPVPEHAAGSAAPQSLDRRLAAALETLPSDPAHSAAEFAEQLSMLKRWYYRSHRDGEIFFRDRQSQLPIRRMVNALSRVYSTVFSISEPTPPTA